MKWSRDSKAADDFMTARRGKATSRQTSGEGAGKALHREVAKEHRFTARIEEPAKDSKEKLLTAKDATKSRKVAKKSVNSSGNRGHTICE